MNLPVLFSFVSAAIAALFVVIAPFSKSRGLPLWVFAFGMLALAAEQLLTGLALQKTNPLEIAELIRWRFAATSLLPGLWLLFSATYSRGNLKQNLSKRLPLVIVAFVLPITLVVSAPASLAHLIQHPEEPFQWIVTLDWAGFFLHVFMLLSMIGAMVGLERTYRASVGTLRWKIKFMLYGMGTLFAARFFTSSQIVLAQQIDPSLETINAVALFTCCLLVARSVFRKGSFEIDLYPSQSIISGSLVISLAGGYLIAVGVLSKVIAHFGGDQAFAIQTFLVLIALVGLGVLVQSDRFRQLIRRFVSRNFQRPLYDYRTLWLKLTATTAQSVRRKDICESTTKLLANLFDTKLTSIWLLDANGTSFDKISTTDHTEDAEMGNTPSSIPADNISEELTQSPDPRSIEGVEDAWAQPILASNPSSFDDGGNRILVPLTGQGRPVGFIVLGDRTNTLEFTQQEFDTLRCIGDHIAANILSAALTRKLEESKEIEAFQTMATFFVHDLKNAVSTLNLMLKNMPLHWDNPEFREDALRGIGNTSNRITDLITRLSQVRHELEISPSPTDLEELLRSAIAEWEKPEQIDFSSEIPSDITVAADFKKLKSVILNLLINACEAMEGTGSIALKAGVKGPYAEIVVTDSGCGMSADFIRNGLFRPFKTTKKSGLGIGMFQSKMVVEAHGGNIMVESQEGQGSVFTIRIPILTGP
ncbi:XrtA/PEP-CTERM system histidine kinase PrsK [Pelagicoccus sp. SDUM812005]|uniref:XrtA/PEP-CTERM system histidine kinase PrsK n=1 Tax=Pelagicoccus sp. SDUM812005 TaxID=3041257 RepID=UPI00280E0C3A|nr:XrtA/PEP-CTERM system histidine kinase PrsK [Pelagicoccus sp. SDUM812005]MDQ8182007.1 PEP-CTERM system histidine kinase PrsK [Pelagicoccus sp. SDUM812005]